jgi:hypothetical protein
MSASPFPRFAKLGGGLAAWILGLFLVVGLRGVAGSPGFLAFQVIAAIAALATAVAFLRELEWAPRVANFFVFLMLAGAVASFVLAGRAIDLISASLLAVVAFAASAVVRARSAPPPT